MENWNSWALLWQNSGRQCQLHIRQSFLLDTIHSHYSLSGLLILQEKVFLIINILYFTLKLHHAALYSPVYFHPSNNMLAEQRRGHKISCLLTEDLVLPENTLHSRVKYPPLKKRTNKDQCIM